jgi:hypothetical protein
MSFNNNAAEVKEQIFYLIDSEGEFSPSHMIGLQFALAKTAEKALCDEQHGKGLGIAKFASTMLQWCYNLKADDSVTITPEMINAMKTQNLRVDRLGCFFGECLSAISDADKEVSFEDALENSEDLQGFVVALIACINLTYEEAKKMEDAA